MAETESSTKSNVSLRLRLVCTKYEQQYKQIWIRMRDNLTLSVPKSTFVDIWRSGH